MNTRRFEHLWRGIFLLLGLWQLPAAAQPVAVDKVIAIAEDGVVLKSEFDERWQQAQEQIAAGATAPPEDILRQQILDQLVIESLQLQMAERNGIRVDDNELNQALAAIAQENGMNFEQFTQALQQQGLYAQTREAIRRQLIIGNFENAAVNRRIAISRQEVENYLRSEAGIISVAPEYRVAHILIPASSNSSAAQRAELVRLLHQELLNGADILRVAASRQISGIEVSGGDLGFRKPVDLPTVFQDVVPDMQRGEIREPFSNGDNWHIVQLLDTRGGANLSVEQFHVRHILITPNLIRTEEQAEELIHDLHARILAGEDFADIARQNTDDQASMVSGGDLEWIEDGMLPPEFLAKVRETPVGSMSEPFRVPTGWHIIEVLDRRVQDVTEDNKRMQAQRVLRQRKYENERQNWITELRDTSHIEYFDF